jgi:hypothetical protein
MPVSVRNANCFHRLASKHDSMETTARKIVVAGLVSLSSRFLQRSVVLSDLFVLQEVLQTGQASKPALHLPAGVLLSRRAPERTELQLPGVARDLSWASDAVPQSGHARRRPGSGASWRLQSGEGASAKTWFSRTATSVRWLSPGDLPPPREGQSWVRVQLRPACRKRDKRR